MPCRCSGTAYRETTSPGAQGVRGPQDYRDSSRAVRLATVAAYGDTILTSSSEPVTQAVLCPGLLCIVATVSALHDNGIESLAVLETYYESPPAWVRPIDEPLPELARLSILVDRDDAGYPLQICTKPVQDRPTVFFEVIQRKGSRGFGKGDFKALFEAIEREQARRRDLQRRRTLASSPQRKGRTAGRTPLRLSPCALRSYDAESPAQHRRRSRVR